MSGVQRIYAKNLYDGECSCVLQDQVVSIEEGRVVSVEQALPGAKREQNTLFAQTLAPGFIDMQINGAGDVMFNDTPDVSTLETMCTAARKGGTAHILATFTTAPNKDYERAIGAAQAAIASDVAGVLGIHLEGPFVSAFKAGIHPAECVRAITAEDIEVLLRPFAGVRLITLAPEEDRIGAIKTLSNAGWIVFAGHSNATAAEMREARADGLGGATHLFNAMSQMKVREPGVVGYILSAPGTYAGIIADGFHVHELNIDTALKTMGPHRLALVTDAMPTLEGISRGFEMGGNAIALQNGRLVDAKGTLAGAHLSMDQAVQNMIKISGAGAADAIRMASTTPANALGLQNELGKIKPGFRASFTLLDSTLSARGVVVDGVYFNSGRAETKTAGIKLSGGSDGHN